MGARAIEYTIVACALGRLLVAGTERGVCHVRFGDADGGDADGTLARGLAEEFPCAALRRNDARLAAWSGALLDAIAGRAPELRVPLDVRGSRFQRRVWDALCAIPRGETRSYSEVARVLGLPRGARAVARACATNPVAVLVPCHRVVAAGGGLGGYAWGVERKRALLEREAAAGVAAPGWRLPARAGMLAASPGKE